jgi:hypothetical protein
MQQESEAFSTISSTPFSLVLATIKHTAIPMSPAHPWKIHPQFSVQFSCGFALGFAMLVQITRSTAMTFPILSRGVSGHTRALTDILSMCELLSNLF